MELVIVTGMSGAGKSTAMKMMEDMGYFCIDNLPSIFFDKFMDLFRDVHVSKKNIAVGMDVRSGEDLDDLKNALDKLPEREKRIMALRFGLYGKEEKTQKEVADMLGISQSYISRLEKKIVQKLKKEISKVLE